MPHSSARPQYTPLEKGQPGFTLLVTGLLALAWVVTAWLVADQFARWRSSDLLATHENQINRSVETIALGLDRDLTMLHGLPAVLGQNSLLIDALRASNATVPPDRAAALGPPPPRCSRCTSVWRRRAAASAPSA